MKCGSSRSGIGLKGKREGNIETLTKTILVTGGAGFIGSNFIRHTLNNSEYFRVVNLDAVSYAGNPANLDEFEKEMPDRYRFVHGDISDNELVNELLEKEKPVGVIHFAAESHVDRSIHGPTAFVETNVLGTCRLLETCRGYWERCEKPEHFKFLHVSTDEVYGSLGEEGRFFETTPYDPSSPYSASKAGSDHLVRAWHRTFGFPTIITNCSNNYGPYQFPEKLIPLMIINLLESKTLPVYGDGKNVRDWLFVIDHCEALLAAYIRGVPGETYNIGGGAERQNIEVVHLLCDLLDDRLKRSGKESCRSLIRFVADRPGHDRRYAIDASKIKRELGWEPRYQFETAMAETVDWYLSNRPWIEYIRSGEYRSWIDKNYKDR